MRTASIFTAALACLALGACSTAVETVMGPQLAPIGLELGQNWAPIGPASGLTGPHRCQRRHPAAIGLIACVGAAGRRAT